MNGLVLYMLIGTASVIPDLIILRERRAELQRALDKALDYGPPLLGDSKTILVWVLFGLFAMTVLLWPAWWTMLVAGWIAKKVKGSR